MNLENLIKLLRNLKIVTFEKGEIVIKEGERKKDVYYIRKGLVRSFLVDDSGEEVTFQLFAEQQTFTNAHSVLFNNPSKFHYQALERTKMYTVDYHALLELTSKNAVFLELNRNLFGMKIIQQSFQRMESFVFLSPEERYHKFVKDNPKLIHRVPDKYIANVLGITPVSLSRIRGRIATKK